MDDNIYIYIWVCVEVNNGAKSDNTYQFRFIYIIHITLLLDYLCLFRLFHPLFFPSFLSSSLCLSSILFPSIPSVFLFPLASLFLPFSFFVFLSFFFFFFFLFCFWFEIFLHIQINKFYIIFFKNHITILKRNTSVLFKRPNFPDRLVFSLLFLFIIL